MNIREIEEDELDELLLLYEDLHSEDTPLPDTQKIETVWLDILSNMNLKYFGAYDGKTLVSTCALTIIPNMTRSCKPYGLIENVVTSHAFRKRGFGKSVLSYALNYAWNMDCYKVMLLTGRKSNDTFRFYESVGFNRQAKQGFIAMPANSPD